MARVVTPHALELVVLLDGLDQRIVASGEPQVLCGLLIDREEPNCGAVLRGHVGDGRSIGDRHVCQTGSEELHELTDDAVFSEHLGNSQHQVGRSSSLCEVSGEAKPDDFWNQHEDWLPDHRSLSLDTAYAPSNDSEAVDHCRMGVGSDQ